MRCSCSCPCMHITGQRFTPSSPTALAVRTDAAVASTRNAPQRGSKPLLSCARHCASPASQFQTEMERDRHSTCSLAESSAVWGLLMSIALQPSDGLAFGAAGLSSKNLDRARAGNISERSVECLRRCPITFPIGHLLWKVCVSSRQGPAATQRLKSEFLLLINHPSQKLGVATWNPRARGLQASTLLPRSCAERCDTRSAPDQR